jgi:peptidoglycan/LPS O-acetylase OafA/YrhL
MFVNAARNAAGMNTKLVATRTAVMNLAGVNIAGHSHCTEWTWYWLVDGRCSCLVVGRALLCSWRAWWFCLLNFSSNVCQNSFDPFSLGTLSQLRQTLARPLCKTTD